MSELYLAVSSHANKSHACIADNYHLAITVIGSIGLVTFAHRTERNKEKIRLQSIRTFFYFILLLLYLV